MTHILAIIVSQPLFPCSANSFLCYARFERFGDSATVDSRLRGNDGEAGVRRIPSLRT